MRRLAFVVLAALGALAWLFTGAAWAPTISIQIRNETSNNVKIEVFQAPPKSFQRYELRSTIHHEVIPNETFHASGIEPESCVLVRVVHDNGDPNEPCRDNHTPLDVRCDVSSQYSCQVHRGDVRDVVLNVVQPGA